MEKVDYCSLINHLSDAEKEELYEQYINGETNDTLIAKYRINVSITLFYKIFAPIDHDSDACSSCGAESLISKRPTKKSYKGWYHLDLICTSCGFVETVAQKIHRININQQYTSVEYQPIGLSTLTFTDRIVLLTLLRGRATEKLDAIEPIIPSPNREAALLFPTTSYTHHCLTELVRKKIIIFDLHRSDLSPGWTTESVDILTLFKSYFLPNVSCASHTRLSIQYLQQRLIDGFSEDWPSSWLDEIYSIWITLSTEEVMQMVESVLNNYSTIHFSADTPTRRNIDHLLNKNRPVSEVLYFAYYSVMKAAQFASHDACTCAVHAGNTIPKKLLQLSDKYITDNRPAKRFARFDTNPRSLLSYILFDNILELSEDVARNHCPKTYWNAYLLDHLSSRINDSFFNRHSFNKHFLSCKNCKNPETTVRSDPDNSNKIWVQCPDCGKRSSFVLEEDHHPGSTLDYSLAKEIGDVANV